jgi:ribulose-5-phosphate 4-epimerase/fuculose-1-phosphate aldolase
MKSEPMERDQEIQKLKERVAKATRILFEMGLADFFGHASARIPGKDQILIKPSVSPLGSIRPEGILIVDMNHYQQGDMTDPLMREKGLPPGEVILHIAIYRKRKDVFGVVHTHQLLATTFGIAGKPIVPLHNQTSPFSPATALYNKPDMISNETLASEVADALGDRNGILLRGHGVVVVGRSVEEATVNAIYLERAAKIQILANLIGTPVPLDDEYCKRFVGQIDSLRVRDAFAYFESLLGSPIKGLS